ncbi:bactericidal permeability increasing protein [Elysia marginata]|uniref:Bactericidal permeability increasing protein n=1 Tax=Elysia marginata TaxID=1093978 RepID=A0AAV4HBB5_9GAST|nr:bactericidal permeability increasing protein [Elysia marginata]
MMNPQATAVKTMKMFRVLFLVLVCAELCNSANPGVKIRVTKKGIDYANSVAQRLLTQQLRTLGFPNQSSQSGKTSISVTNIRVEGVSIPSSSIALSPQRNGLTWAISNFGITVRANYRAVKRGWIRLSNSGSLRASVSGVTVRETLAFGRSSSGRPTISHAGCSGSVASVSVRFYGSWSWLINLFRRRIGRSFRDQLRPEICKQVIKLVNGKLQTSLAGLPVTADVANNFSVDYRLVTSPRVTSDYIEISHKGTVYSKSNRREPPFSAQAIPPWTSNSRMVYVWVTQYSFNTLLYQAHTSGMLKYQVTRNQLPVNSRSYLDTTCPGACIGNTIPQTLARYPRTSVEMSLESAAMPKATMTFNRLTIDVSFKVEAKVRFSNNAVNNLVSFNVNASLTFKPNIRRENLNGEVTNYSLRLSDIKFANDQVLATPAQLDTVLTRVLGLTVIPKLNVLAARGVQLPAPGDARFTNSYISIRQGYLMIGTDVAMTL